MGATLETVTTENLKDLIDAIEDKLDSSTHGLAALKVLIDAVEAKLDDPSKGLANLKALIDALGGKLDSDIYGLSALKTLIDAIEAKLDDPAKGLTALKTLIDAIEAKLDNAIYGLPAMNIDLNTIIALLGTPAGASIAADILALENKLDNGTWGLSALNDDLDTLLSRLTLVRSVYLDELDFDLDAREQDIAFGDVVYVDDGGVAGTAFPLGTPTHPVSNLADALTIAGTRNLERLHMHGTHTVVAGIAGFRVFGGVGPFGATNIILAAGVSIANCIFDHCLVSGTANGWAVYQEGCILLGVSALQGLVRNCNLYGTINLGSGMTDLDNTTTVGGPITLDLDDIAGGMCVMHNIIGTVTLTNLDSAGTVKIYSAEGANITIAASCTAGTIEIHGNCNVTDNSAGSTVTDRTNPAYVHIIEDESTYNDTTLHEVKANKEYPILEVVLSGGVVTVYNYEWDVGDADADPSETQARTEITHFSADAFELSKIFVNINKATNGLWTRMGASDKARLYAKYYDSTASAFVLVPDIVLRDKAADTLITALPVETDLGEAVIFNGNKVQLASRFIVYFYVDNDINYLVEIPFTFGIRRI